MSANFNCIIMGAAGRDFHDFQTFFRRNPRFRVCAFTATQIPFIESRVFPRSLAGPDYESDIPILPEQQLADLIRQYDVDFVFLAYSDLPHRDVMHKASLVQACGAGFVLLGPRATQLKSRKPVISVTAVRTGAGKSPLTQHLARFLTDSGRTAGIIRHPMPYGDLSRQRVERIATLADLDRFECTIEEREEYRPYVQQGLTIYAGVDYAEILAAAEADADVVLWDGGNNDFSFVRPGLSIVVADALRAGHELNYYPGETSFRSADVLVISKVTEATDENIRLIRSHAEQFNPRAEIIEADLEIDVSDPAAIADRRVLVVEDGPTVTHGGMSFGAGTLAARKFGAAELVDPRPYAVRSIAEAFNNYPHLKQVLPALGYSPRQRDELRETINAAGADVVVDASPAGLEDLLELTIPVVRVRYRFRQISGSRIEDLVEQYLSSTN